MKKLKFRDEFSSYIFSKTKKDIGSSSDFQRSYYLTLFYLEKVYGIKNFGYVPEDVEDLEDGIVDGSGDVGVDFFYKSDNKVTIIQTKYRSKGKKEDYNTIEHFLNCLARLHPSNHKNYKINQDVKDCASRINWKNDNFEMLFITLGSVDENSRAIINNPKIFIDGLPEINSRINAEIYDENDLNIELRDIEDYGESVGEVKLQLVKSDKNRPWIVYSNENQQKSYVGIINGATLANLWNSKRSRLFWLNIRSSLGETNTNKNIIETAKGEPTNFFYYNNGISCLASNIQENEEKSELVCDNLSIINGAQTVRSIQKAYSDDQLSVEDVQVLIRISEVSFQKKQKNINFLENITRYNNTQNLIKVSDFRSNDPIQNILNKRFKNISINGKFINYKNKRTDKRAKNSITITMEQFAKTIHSFKYGPIDLFGGVNALFDPDKRYKHIFGDGEVINDDINDEDFFYHAGIILIFEQLLEIRKSYIKEISTSSDDEETKQLLIKSANKWFAIYTINEIFNRIQNVDIRTKISKLCKDQWFSEPGDDRYFDINSLTRFALKHVARVYRNASKTENFTQRNWQRDKKTLDEVKIELSLSSDLDEVIGKLKYFC